jgi:hypothetical protein
MRRILSSRVVLGVMLVAAVAATAAELKRETSEAFDQYVRIAEAAMDRDIAAGIFLRPDALSPMRRSDAYAKLRGGELQIERAQGDEPIKAPGGGLIHDWIATEFIPGVTLDQTLAVVHDYDHLEKYYAPDVVRSRRVSGGDDQLVIYMRLRRHKVVTVVLDTEYDVRYFRPDATHFYSRSHSTRINEVENAGKPDERDLPKGDGHGFLWRMDSYWHFLQANGGVYVQCRVISLTRDVPTGLNWLIRPFIESVPRESLKFTMDSTRTAVEKQAGKK